MKEESSSSGTSKLSQVYVHNLRRRLLLGGLLIFLLSIGFLLSLRLGTIDMGFRELLDALLGSSERGRIIWEIRLSRALGALLVGASLGLSGALLQNILKNPLASPFTLGLSQGAIFGASFAIIVLGFGLTYHSGTQGFTILNYYMVALSAFLGAMLVSLLIFLLSLYRDITPQAMILAGVALGSLFHSATMFLQYLGTDFQVAATVYWTFGDLAKLGLREVKFIAPLLLLGLALALFLRWPLNALLFGEEVAKNLGVSPRALRLGILILVSFMTALPTSLVGIIGFIGLISPHLVRLFIGEDQRFLLPYSALMGALLLLFSDLLARLILYPRALPVGIVTSLAGAPLFFYLILRRGRL